MPNPPDNAAEVGVVGLGLLGTALCERLLEGGYRVRCFNRTESKAAPLLERGAVWSDNPFVECQRVVICLFNSEAVKRVLDGFRGAVREGQLVVDATTGGPDDAEEIGGMLAASGARYLESPIAASSEQTRQGKATAFIGGDLSDYEGSRDLIDCLAPNSHYVGGWGAAAKFKLVNNLILGLNRAALAEGIAFAGRLGLDEARAVDVLRQCNAYSGVMDTKGGKMVSGDFTTQAKLSQHAKDVRIILDEAAKRGLKLPLSTTHLDLLERGEQMGIGELDNSAIIRVFRRPLESGESK